MLQFKTLVIAPSVSSDAASRLREAAKRAGVLVVDATDPDNRVRIATAADAASIEVDLLWGALRAMESAPPAEQQAGGVDLSQVRPEGASCEVLAPLTQEGQPVRDATFGVGAIVTFNRAPVGWIAYAGNRAARVDAWQRVRVVGEQPQSAETKLSELYPMVRQPTPAAQAGCPGGPIAWSDGARTYVCYYCRRAYYACSGIFERGEALHAGCLRASVDVRVLHAPLRAHLTCSRCGKAWAPFPKVEEREACEAESRRVREAFLARDVLAVQDADDAANGARLRVCRSFGGFVHGDEGLGCWRCGADRQAHS